MPSQKVTRVVMLFLAVCLTATSMVWGQASGGTFTGIVKDSNGAVIPNASIAIKALATGVETTYKSTSEGVFLAPSLTPGSYLLTVQAKGFKREEFGPVTLQVNQTVRVDFALSVGEITQAIQVEASGAQLLQTESGEISQVIGSQQVAQLPLNGRTWQQLIGLTAGVTPGSPGETGSPNSFNINGQRGKGNLFLADGISTTSSAGGGGGGLGVSLDAIQEFSVLQNSYSAEHGNVAGGVINVQTKSGTNKWHGSAFEYLRNDKLDAANFFSNATGQPKNSLRYNQFGGSLGGPIRRDKTFIFGDYQGTRTRAANPVIATVPLPAERQGDFSNFRDASGKVIPIYDPVSAPNRIQFSHNGVPNVIPPNRISPVANALLKLLPLPNQFDSARRPLAFNNYAATRKNSNTADSFDVRFDHYFSPGRTLFVRHSYGSSNSFTPSVFGPPLGGDAVGGIGLAGTFPSRGQSTAISFIYLIRPNLVNDFRFGLLRSFGELTQENVGKNLSEQFGIPGVNRDRDTSGLSSLSISGLFNLGDSILTPLRVAGTNPSFSDRLRWTFGRQTISTGFDFAKENANVFFLLFPRGFYVFEPLMTGSLTDLLTTGNPNGSALASFITGFPTAVVRDTLPGTVGERFPRYGMFFQDDIKATTRLTLSLGVRYEILPPSTESHNRQANFDIATGRMLLAGVQTGKRLRKTDFRNIGPRIGLAYALTGDRKTVLRSGYGIAYVDSLRHPGPANGPEFNPPFRVQDSLVQIPIFTGVPPLAINSLLPPLVIPPLDSPPRGDLRYLPPNDRNTYSQTWNLGIQRAITNTMIAEVAYVGSKGTRLLSPVNLNQAPPGLQASPGRRPFGPNLGLIRSLALQGNSSYHGLQAKAEKRFSKGLFFLGSYTWSKAIDGQSTGTDGSAASGTEPQDSTNLRAERGVSGFDIPHRFIYSAIWEVPYGQGRRFGGSISQPLNFILGGWQVSGIYVAQMGTRVSIRTNCSNINADGGSCRPNRLKDGNLADGKQTIQRWFDTSAFAIPATPVYGNAGRNIVRVPGLSNFDVGISKYFRWGKQETKRFQFRAEMFNAFNNPHFRVPNTLIDSPGFGAITSAGEPRLIQFGLRLEF